MDTVISMTTIPSRVHNIKPCVDSLRNQGLPVYVWIQESVERTGNVFTGEIPDFLQGGCVHAEVVPEYGPITKLLPALEMGADKIITADDDMVYGEGWAEGLLEIPHPLSALGYRGRRFRAGARSYNRTQLVKDVEAPVSVDLITGVFGVYYQADFFGDSIFGDWKKWRRNDDLVINMHLRERRVGRMVVPCPCEIERIPGVFDTNSLYQDVNRRLNDKGLEKLGWWEGA